MNRAFGQNAPAQPLHQFEADTDAEIRMVMHSRSERAMQMDTTVYQGKLITDYVILNFWVSAKKPGEGQSEYLAQSIAEKLKALLTNPDTRYELAERGITHLQPQGPPAVVPQAEYSKRLVSCNAQLVYSVQYGGTPITELPGEPLERYATQAIQFWRETPLLTDTYLLGFYRWALPVQVNRATVRAWAPQGQDVVLRLEVGGEGVTPLLTIPQGEPNEEVSAEMVFTGVKIAAGQEARWRVVSAPAGEFTAWQASLDMEIQKG